MAIQQLSGSEIINRIEADSHDDQTFYLRSYLTFGSLANEAWNTVDYDDSSRTISINSKSAEGSTISFKQAKSGSETNGTESGSFSANGKLEGLKTLRTWKSEWSDGYQNDQHTTNYSYSGESSTKEDDIAYKLTYTSVHYDSNSK